MNETISIGFAITGSFCTFAKTLTLLSELVKQGYEVQPIFSNHTSHLDNRFTAAETFCKKVERITGNTGIYTIQDAEPIGPKAMYRQHNGKISEWYHRYSGTDGSKSTSSQ